MPGGNKYGPNIGGFSDDQLEAFGQNSVYLTDAQRQATEDYLRRKNKALLEADLNKDPTNQGSQWGARMREMAGRPMYQVGVDTQGIRDSAALEGQSYGLQNNAMGLMRARAMGTGPSAASIQQGMGLDAASRSMSGASNPAALRAGLMSGGMEGVVGQAGQARGAESASGLSGWGQGAQALRAGSLGAQQQALGNLGRAQDISFGQQEQDLKRRLAYEALGLKGYGMSLAGHGQRDDIRAGDYARQVNMANQDLSAGLAAGGSAITGLMGSFGKQGGQGGQQSHPNYANMAPGSYDWDRYGGGY